MKKASSKEELRGSWRLNTALSTIAGVWLQGTLRIMSGEGLSDFPLAVGNHPDKTTTSKDNSLYFETLSYSNNIPNILLHFMAVENSSAGISS